MIGQTGQLVRHGAEGVGAQPDIAEGGVVQHDENYWQPVARGCGDLHAAHAHAAIAGDDGDPAPGRRALDPCRGGDGPAHGAEIGGGDIGARLIGLPVMAGEGAMGAGI